MVFTAPKWGWKRIATRMLLVPVLGGCPAAFAQAPPSARPAPAGGQPAARTPAAPAVARPAGNAPVAPTVPPPAAGKVETRAVPGMQLVDPKAVLKEGRKALADGRLNDAQDLAQRAEALNGGKRWGLFDDTPNSLVKDIQAAAAKARQAEADQLVRQAKAMLAQPGTSDAQKHVNLTQALRLARRAEELHGPYSVWDLGDRADKMAREIEAALAQVKPAPAPSGTAVAAGRPAPKPATAAAAGTPTTAGTWGTKPTPAAPPKPGAGPTAVAAGPSFMPAVKPAAATPAGATGGVKTADLASRPGAPSGVTPAKADAAAANRDAARKVMAEGRRLADKGDFAAAKAKYLEAQNLHAEYAKDEVTPEHCLQELGVRGRNAIEQLVKEGQGRTAAKDYEKADAALTAAGEIVTALGLFARPVDEAKHALHAASGGKHGVARGGQVQVRGSDTKSPVTPAAAPTLPAGQVVAAGGLPTTPPAMPAMPAMPTPPAPVKPVTPEAPAPVAALPTPPAAPAAPAKVSLSGTVTGRQMLDQAALEFRKGDLEQARKLALQAHNLGGVHADARGLLNQIDAEAFAQKKAAAAKSFDAAVQAHANRDYRHAMGVLALVDPKLLPEKMQGKRDELLTACKLELDRQANPQAAVAVAVAPASPGVDTKVTPAVETAPAPVAPKAVTPPAVAVAPPAVKPAAPAAPGPLMPVMPARPEAPAVAQAPVMPAPVPPPAVTPAAPVQPLPVAPPAAVAVDAPKPAPVPPPAEPVAKPPVVAEAPKPASLPPVAVVTPVPPAAVAQTPPAIPPAADAGPAVSRPALTARTEDPRLPGDVPTLPGDTPRKPLAADAKPDSLAGQVAAMREVTFQKLRADGLKALSDAQTAFGRGETDLAIQMLSDYSNRVRAANLEAGRTALLLKPVDYRLETFGIMKHNVDALAREKIEKREAKDRIVGKATAEEQRRAKIAELMREYHALVKEKADFKAAEKVALQAKQLDPDDPAVGALAHMATMQRRVREQEALKKSKEEMVYNGLTAAEQPGPSVDIKDPVAFDLERHAIAGRRRLDDAYLKTRTPAEFAIESRLEGHIQIEFNQVPLRQALQNLSEKTRLPIVPDYTGTEAEGISLDKPVTLQVPDSLSVKNVLSLLLDQAHLNYVIENDVVKVTTQKKSKGRLYTKVFSVADLVTPIPNFALPDYADIGKSFSANARTNPNAVLGGLNTAPPGMPVGHTGMTAAQLTSGGQGMPGAAGGQANATLNSTQPIGPGGTMGNVERQTKHEQLMKLVTGMVRPYTWDGMGGPGKVEYYDIGSALVVNQTADVIREVADLLEALRRLQDLAVAVEIRVISLSETFFERMGVDFAVNVKTHSTGFEPNLTSGVFRPEPFINDNNTKGQVVGLTPAGSFTPDLDVPIRATSFPYAIPGFGNYPNNPGFNGGVSLGLAFLNDIQVFMFMEAAQGNRRINVMQAPKITLFNGQSATISVATETYFVNNVQVFSVNGQIVFIPTNQVFPIGTDGGGNAGFGLGIQAVISADRRFVRLNCNFQLNTLAGATVPLFPITTFVTPVFEGGSQGVPIPFTQFIQQPSIATVGVNTTVVCPDGGTVLVGGLKYLGEGRNEFGPPFLSKIPYVNRLFKNVGIGRETVHLMLMVTPRIIITAEEEIAQTEGRIAGPQP